MLVWTRTLTEMHIFAFPDRKKKKFQEILNLVPSCQFVSSSFYKKGWYYTELLQLETNL